MRKHKRARFFWAKRRIQKYVDILNNILKEYEINATFKLVDDNEEKTNESKTN